MANGKVASYRMEIRMAIADAMVNGREYGEIRGYLVDCGVAEADLPSDHSLKTYQESVEYRTVYEDRMEACNLQLQAGRVAGCASARVALIQHRILGGFEKWLDEGLASPADIFKMFTLTLQYKRQELAERKLALQEGKAAVEALGPQEFSAERLDAIMDRLAAERAAADAAAAAAAEQAAQDAGAARDTVRDVSAGGGGEEGAGGRRIPQDIAGSGRISEGSAGERRRGVAVGGEMAVGGAEDPDGYVDAGDAGVDGEGEWGDDPSIQEDIGGFRRIPQAAGGGQRILRFRAAANGGG